MVLGTPDRERRHRRLEAEGRRTISRWLGHPAVEEIVTRWRQAAEEAVGPLARHLVDHESVTLFAARALDVTGRWPDGKDWPNPFATWPLSRKERAQAPAVAQSLREVIASTAAELSKAGALLDRQAPPDQLVLAQLLFLEVDWQQPRSQLADHLNILPRGGWTRTGQMLALSDIRAAATASDLVALQGDYRERTAQRSVLAPPAAGRPRQTGTWAAAEEFASAVRQAVASLRRQGHRPTQEAVAQYFRSQSKLPGSDDRQLRRWCRRFDLDWYDLLA